MSKIRMVCPFCGSENITSSATVEWYEFGQYWRIVDVHDYGGHCHSGDCLADDFDPKETPV